MSQAPNPNLDNQPPHSIRCPNCGVMNSIERIGTPCIECLVDIPERRKPEVARTGAVRDQLYPKGREFPARWDLMFDNDSGMRRLAETYGDGFAKYGACTWMKGFPKSVLIAHALDHIAKYKMGDESEDHLAHAAWNLLTMCWMEEHKPEMCFE